MKPVPISQAKIIHLTGNIRNSFFFDLDPLRDTILEIRSGEFHLKVRSCSLVTFDGKHSFDNRIVSFKCINNVFR